MEKIRLKSTFLVENISTTHLRGLHQRIDWSDRLVCITGARGTGKTTLLLQRLKLKYPQSEVAIYVSMDDIYFASATLVDLAESLRAEGVKHVFLDEVHKYPGWAREIKNIYDTYKDISIVFTGSSVIDIYNQEADLSRRAIFYELPGLSFREYLQFSNVIQLDTYKLDAVLKNHTSIALKLDKEFTPLKYFKQYLDHGYYPFFIENINTYFIRIEQVVRLIIETELRFISGFDANNIRKVFQLLVILAENVPFKPNISKLSEKIGISRATLVEYLHYLNKARVINMLSAEGKSISILQKPDKIYLENLNLHKALASENKVDKGSARESFFLNQLLNTGHEISLSPQSDFLVDNKYTFEIGGKDKSSKQVRGIANAFVAVDDIAIGTANKIPLWLFGMLY